MTHRKTYKTESVPTNTLAVGDLILAHGGLFRVFEVKTWPNDGNERAGHTQSNYCEFIGDAQPGYACSIPAHWRDGREASTGRPALDNYWCQQGNGLARTTRVLAILETEQVA